MDETPSFSDVPLPQGGRRNWRPVYGIPSRDRPQDFRGWGKRVRDDEIEAANVTQNDRAMARMRQKGMSANQIAAAFGKFDRQAGIYVSSRIQWVLGRIERKRFAERGRLVDLLERPGYTLACLRALMN